MGIIRQGLGGGIIVINKMNKMNGQIMGVMGRGKVGRNQRDRRKIGREMDSGN